MLSKLSGVRLKKIHDRNEQIWKMRQYQKLKENKQMLQNIEVK